MSLNILHETLTPHQQARLFYSGFLVIMFLGIAAALALVIGAMWLVSQVFILALESVLQAAQTLSALYQSSGPFIQFCILVSLAWLAYQAGKRVLARRAIHERI